MRIKVNKRGFLLFEVLVSLAVLTFFLSAIGPLVKQTLKMIEVGRLRIESLEKAIRVLEGTLDVNQLGGKSGVIVKKIEIDGVICRQVKVSYKSGEAGEICLVGPPAGGLNPLETHTR